MITSGFAISALLVLASLTGLSVAASAQGRLNSAAMACSQARAIVNSSGAAVLGTGPRTFDRYVRSQGFCAREEMATPAWVRTADVGQCFVGYTCESRTGRDPR